MLKNQKQAAALAFAGIIAVTLSAVDFKKLKFTASVRVTDGAGVSTTFEPCNDDGEIKTFSNADDVLTWLKNTYTDMTTVTFSVAMAGITKLFTPPLDALKDAIKKRTEFVKLEAGIADNLTAANQKVTADVAAGYDLVTAHPALQAIYAADVARAAKVLEIKTFYTDEKTRWNGIVVAAGGVSL